MNAAAGCPSAAARSKNWIAAGMSVGVPCSPIISMPMALVAAGWPSAAAAAKALRASSGWRAIIAAIPRRYASSASPAGAVAAEGGFGCATAGRGRAASSKPVRAAGNFTIS